MGKKGLRIVLLFLAALLFIISVAIVFFEIPQTPELLIQYYYAPALLGLLFLII